LSKPNEDTRDHKERYRIRKRNNKKYGDLPLEVVGTDYAPGSVSVMQNPQKNRSIKWLFLDVKGRKLCSAKRYTWEPKEPFYCTRLPENETGRCKLHGARSLRGIMSPNFRHGRKGKFKNSQLFTYYKQALEDPDKHNLDSEISLIDARINELLDSLSDGGGIETFKAVTDAFKSVRIARKSADSYKEEEAYNRLEEVVEDGKAQYNIWKEVHTLMDQRRKMALAEVRRQEISQNMMPAHQVQALIFAIVDAIRAEVEDKDVIQKILTQFNTILGEAVFDVNVIPEPSGSKRKRLKEGEPHAIDGEWEDIHDGYASEDYHT
jgi:hypothetical protein